MAYLLPAAPVVLACAGLGVWLYLAFGRGFFWMCRARDDGVVAPTPAVWPAIAAVVPARDEADVIARLVTSLLQQDYPGPLHLVITDDQSSDGTAQRARAAAARIGAEDRLTVIDGVPPPPGWTGKPWAMRQGLAVVEAVPDAPALVLFTDADISYDAGTLRRLVSIALARQTVLTSLMVRLRQESAAERWLVPAFVFFFQMLYPFRWVADAARPMAAAAGGCMLVRRDALTRAGGIERLCGALIDDCAMGALLKPQGRIWLGLTTRVHSLRAYETVGAVAAMVSRSAYAQLRYSPLLLAAAVAGMGLTYLAPPLVALLGHGAARAVALTAWALMTLCYVPMLRLYGRAPADALALPLIAIAYMGFTLQSAIQSWQGRGGAWKNRVQGQSSFTARTDDRQVART